MTDIPARLAAALADRYRLERELGQGGMATVWLAHDLRHDRPVAVKVLRSDLAAALGRDRFLREIRTVAALTHPNILPLHDSGEAADTLFYVMPLATGESLRDRLARASQLPFDEALLVTREVAGALDYAHRQGVVHRDIKPENILLSEGHAVVADFGIAAVLGAAGHDKLTSTGLAVGTPAYMSPEQALGAPVDGRCDVYSLGCLLYEMLSGAPPFTGASVQAVVARHVSDPVPSLRTVRATVPAGLERVVNKALAKAPADRFATAGEFAAALPQHVDLLAPEPAPELPAAPPIRRWPRWVAGVGGALLLLVVALGAWLGTRGDGRAAGIRFTSLAVQPFRNLTGDTAQAFLAEGATDQVVNSLVRLSALRVIDLRGANPDVVPDLLRDNAVGAVLTGSVQRVGEAVRITVHLRSATGQALPGGGTYNGVMTDLLALQDQVARSVADSIQVSMTPEERTRLGAARREVSPAAYEAYARGRVFLGKVTGPDMRQSITYFNRAIAADSGYADAWSGLANAYVELGYYGLVPPVEAFPTARAAAVRALALDSTQGSAYAMLGIIEYLHTWDFPSAERAFRRAVDLSPGDARVHLPYGTFLAVVGRQQESIAEATLAQKLDPVSLLISAAAARPYYNARRYDEAIAQSFKTLELDSSFTRALFWLGLSYEQTSRIPEAVRTLERLVTLAPIPVYLAALGHAYAVAGRRADAERMLEELQARGRTGYVSSFDIATIHAGLGNRSEALDWLERAYEGRATYLTFVNVDPRFDAYRDDPRFRELVSRMGLAGAP